MPSERYEFAAKRKTVLEDAEKYFRAIVEDALAELGQDGWYEPILVRVEEQFDKVYREEAGSGSNAGKRRKLIAGLTKSLAKTKANSKDTPARISSFLATATVNAATEAAALDGDETPAFEWVTMHDKNVRTTHKAADGQIREDGAAFHVGGSEMDFPGDTSAPIEEWAGCRCVLRPTKDRQPALVASATTDPALWHGDDQTSPESGDVMTAAVDTTAPTDVPTDAPLEAPPETIEPPVATPWHGVLAPEGVFSGDKRKFGKGSLSNRDLPLPLTWQKASAEGHDGSVVVAMIQGMTRIPGEGDSPNLINAYGLMISNAEADEVIGQMAAFGKMGVSVDVDDATFDYNPDDDSAEFSKARVCSASIVTIPAFAEAYITLGPPPAGFMGEAPDAVASDEAMTQAIGAEFGRGPGWITDPVATNRIHRYWTEPGQPGFAKINWGVGGDFDRCRVEVGKYLAQGGDARFINATCAQWHHDALGYWPSTHAKMLGHSLQVPTGTPVGMSLVASSGDPRWTPPGAWFKNPELSELTPMTFSKEPEGMRVFGHCAGWTQCHVGFGQVCVEPFDSRTNFAYFNRCPRPTTDGMAYTGNISLGGGHPDINLNAAATMAAYDDTTTTVADVTVGRDEFGIWFAGWVRPNVVDDDARMAEFYGSTLSPDWRQEEMRHILGVNEGGFQIPRIQTSIVDGVQSLVASSGIVKAHPVMLDNTTPGKATVSTAAVKIDPISLIADGIREYEARNERSKQFNALRSAADEKRQEYINSLRAKHGKA